MSRYKKYITNVPYYKALQKIGDQIFSEIGLPLQLSEPMNVYQAGMMLLLKSPKLSNNSSFIDDAEKKLTEIVKKILNSQKLSSTQYEIKKPKNGWIEIELK